MDSIVVFLWHLLEFGFPEDGVPKNSFKKSFEIFLKLIWDEQIFRFFSFFDHVCTMNEEIIRNKSDLCLVDSGRTAFRIGNSNTAT